MDSYRMLGVGLCWFVLSVGIGSAQQADDSATITAYGCATLEVQPDSVRLFYEVDSAGLTLKESEADNEKQVKLIKTALDKLKIKGLQVDTSTAVQTRVVNVGRGGFNPNAAGGVPAPQAQREYRIHTSLSVTVENADPKGLLEISKGIHDLATGLGASELSDARGLDPRELERRGRSFVTSTAPRREYFTKDLADARRKALREAVKDAVANAEALAGGAEIKVKSITMINSQGDTSQDNVSRIREDLYQSRSSSPTLQIRATVKVQCERIR